MMSADEIWVDEINDKIGLAKRLGVVHGWLYTFRGDNPGFTEDEAEMEEMKKLDGYTVLGEIGKTSVGDMSAILEQVRLDEEYKKCSHHDDLRDLVVTKVATPPHNS